MQSISKPAACSDYCCGEVTDTSCSLHLKKLGLMLMQLIISCLLLPSYKDSKFQEKSFKPNICLLSPCSGSQKPILFILARNHYVSPPFSSVQSLSRVRLFATPWIAAHQASLSINNSQSSLRLTSIESVMPSSHLILCRPLLLLPSTPPSIRVFSNESTLRMRWPKYWSFSFSIIPSK